MAQFVSNSRFCGFYAKIKLAERISQKRMRELLNSPRKLREYEATERRRLQILHDGKQEENEVIEQDQEKDDDNDDDVDVHKEVQSMYRVRGVSTTPSSGYESLNDNASELGGGGVSDFQDFASSSRAIKRRRESSNGKQLSKTAGNNAKKQKICEEYVVEAIESLESVNCQPVVYVKWLNYPSESNTWEALPNVINCMLYEQFVDELTAKFSSTIAEISAEIESELPCQEVCPFSMSEIDKFEPLVLQTDLILLVQFRLAASRSLREPLKIRERITRQMQLKKWHEKRCEQLASLKKWQDRMNDVDKLAHVLVENNVDFERLSLDFTYIAANFAGEGVHIAEDTPIGCKCVDVCSPSAKCCARMADQLFAYDKQSRLRLQPGAAIYECNNRCVCSSECLNRVIQRGRRNVLCLFKTSNGCGWGVRTEAPIRRGEFVSEYVGEIITAAQADERGKQYDAIGRTYLFDLDYNTQMDSVYTIDAALYGNISHFFNHSCAPNLAVFPFFINNLDVNMPRLSFFALRNIKAGEELTFDYIRTDVDYENLSSAEKVICRCGATNCRKVLF